MLGRVALALLLVACTERIELVSIDDAGIDACPGSSCVVRERCGTSGESCEDGSDCCARVCAGGLCEAADGCSVVGESCAGSAACCSGACASDGDRQVVCHALGGCSPAGEICQADAACCDSVARPGACEVFDVSSGAGRCRFPSGCAAGGELCGEDVECCPGGMLGEALCRASQVGGVPRCVNESAGSMCLAEEAVCTTPSECCSRVCAPSVAGQLLCLDGCVSASRACTRDADCCNRSCVRGVCGGGGPGCEPFGASCASSARCCSGLCAADTATCSSPLP